MRSYVILTGARLEEILDNFFVLEEPPMPRKKPRKRTNANVPAKGRLRDMADRLWSLAVRDDWNYKCAVCNAGKVEAHHLIPRQHLGTRYQLKNGIALCSRHHQFDPDTSPHQNAAGWLAWLAGNQTHLHGWYTKTTETGKHREFSETLTADYYCRVITMLRGYCRHKDVEEICGVKFYAWLARNYPRQD